MGAPRLVEKLSYANVWLSLGASGLSVATLYFCGERVQNGALAVAILLPFLSTYVVSTFDDVLRWDPFADAQNDRARTLFVGKHRRGLLVLGAIAAIVGVALAFRSAGGLGAVALFVAPFPIALASEKKLLPASFRYRRLEDVPFAKSATVALTSALVGVSLPIVALGKSPPLALHALLFFWCGARFFVKAVFFDVADVAGHIRAGRRTIPVIYGKERTLRALENVAIGAAAVGIVGGLVSPHRLPAMACAVVCGMYDFTFVRRAKDGDVDARFLCDVVADGMGIFTGFATLFLAFFAH